MLPYFQLLRAAEFAKSSEKIKKNIYAMTVISSRKFRSREKKIRMQFRTPTYF